MREIIIFRHGETDWNREERFQGHIDVPLNDTGREQAAQLIPRLRSIGIDAILSSTLSRAMETAEIIARDLSVPIFRDGDLREAHLGEAQGLTRTEIEKRFGLLARQWRSWNVSDADVFYPGGETGGQVSARAFSAIERFLDLNPFQRVGIATHGGVIRRMMQKVLPLGSEPVPIPNGILYRLEFNPNSRAWNARKL
ncbi:MAG: hypothetical protein A2X94_15700 [Bdellovibrionales bacterium GWB1_55_8]|nr:MAG: hypothetical protein A2X94_15700 [Bdellovibrionales bacterium GWB1_55_8]